MDFLPERSATVGRTLFAPSPSNSTTSETPRLRIGLSRFGVISADFSVTSRDRQTARHHWPAGTESGQQKSCPERVVVNRQLFTGRNSRLGDERMPIFGAQVGSVRMI